MNSNYLKSLRIVYFALAMGIIFFLLVALLLNNLNGALSGSDLTPGEKAPFLVTLVLITGAIFIAYRSIIPKKTITIQSLPTLDRKLTAWREINIVKGALIEAPSFFAIVLFMLLGVYALLVWPVAGLYIFWLTQPTRDKFIEETKLSIADTEEFDKIE